MLSDCVIIVIEGTNCKIHYERVHGAHNYLSCLQEKIEAISHDKVMMEEQQQDLEKDVKQWENTFRQQNGRAPADDDKTASAQERYESLDETTHLLNKLTAQVAALEALRRGDIPAPPVVQKETVEIKETEVTTVEVGTLLKAVRNQVNRSMGHEPER